ncbi:TetR/AcrR family transcriptional regulator [Streptomyces justiciae]|uniref:Helix-turn-helix domain-containing protein n=1 Tax=Streptomyces justiciae TaxID=2780140 RepID=A0ABU3LRP6_9ACTN|nr:helix-turn-helix domain-containing protein [Streptomyces justiciae]MDT7841881.1 helix-turn-helix domain-containing protein [Streptomyces justiciae]
MSKSEAREPIRSNARSNRAKILAAARELLGQNPDATLEEIAQAAGVVRRTVHGHFPGRVALLEALAEEASEALRAASARWPDVTEDPEHAFAGFVLAVWPEGDRYRLLLSLATQDLGQGRVTEALAPARAAALSILERGQRAGVFHDRLPAPALSAAMEAYTLGLLEAVTAGLWEGDGARAAVASLIAVGVPVERAERVVAEVTGREE